MLVSDGGATKDRFLNHVVLISFYEVFHVSHLRVSLKALIRSEASLDLTFCSKIKYVEHEIPSMSEIRLLVKTCMTEINDISLTSTRSGRQVHQENYQRTSFLLPEKKINLRYGEVWLYIEH